MPGTVEKPDDGETQAGAMTDGVVAAREAVIATALKTNGMILSPHNMEQVLALDLDLLVIEVQAAMPCYPAWEHVVSKRGTDFNHPDFDLLQFCPANCTCECPSCTARAALRETEAAR